MFKRKSYTITGKDLLVERRRTALNPQLDPEPDEMVVSGEDPHCSDGYHDFQQLYKQRYAIFVALLKQIQLRFELDQMSREEVSPVWKSKHHSDCILHIPNWPQEFDESGKRKPCCSMFSDSFVCGIGYEPGKQITYHLPLKMWDEVEVFELQKAPEWDGHTAKDVIQRLRNL